MLAFVHVAVALQLVQSAHFTFAAVPARCFSVKPAASHATSPSATTHARNPFGGFFAQISAAHGFTHSVSASVVTLFASLVDCATQLPPVGASEANATLDASEPVTG